jgi:hypothetical protein
MERRLLGLALHVPIVSAITHATGLKAARPRNR